MESTSNDEGPLTLIKQTMIFPKIWTVFFLKNFVILSNQNASAYTGVHKSAKHLLSATTAQLSICMLVTSHLGHTCVCWPTENKLNPSFQILNPPNGQRSRMGTLCIKNSSVISTAISKSILPLLLLLFYNGKIIYSWSLAKRDMSPLSFHSSYSPLIQLFPSLPCNKQA